MIEKEDMDDHGIGVVSNDCEKEIWKTIEDFPRLEVSSFGNVRIIKNNGTYRYLYKYKYKTTKGSYLYVKVVNNDLDTKSTSKKYMDNRKMRI